MTTPFPLAWPLQMPRTAQRRNSQFKTGLAGALNNVRYSLRLFGSDSGHPDKLGGSDAMMAELNTARDQARKERK